MNRQDTIAMAREAVAASGFAFDSECDAPQWLEKFAALVIAKDRERLASNVELPEPRYVTTGDIKDANTFTLDKLRDYGDRRASAEREECAKLCEFLADEKLSIKTPHMNKIMQCFVDELAEAAKDCAEEIRARGQQ